MLLYPNRPQMKTRLRKQPGFKAFALGANPSPTKGNNRHETYT